MLFSWRQLAALLACCASSVGFAQPLLAEPIRPLPKASSSDPARVRLGRALFHDVRLSRDNTQSCASCHKLDHGGADRLARSLGPGGQPTRFNTPTVFNSAFNYRQSWTGAYAGMDGMLDHVFAGPVPATISPWELVASRLTGDAAIGAQFQRAYGDDVSAARVQDALAHYLRSLVTPSRLDRYLRGERAALNADERAGYARFKSYGCVSCHQGINVGGNLYQKIGVMRALVPGDPLGADPGRYLITGRAADRHLFRVPGLRNVALTAPYFHDGSVPTLEAAVEAMFKYQLGRDAPTRDKELIVRFLHALSGEQMPPAGAKP